MTQGDDARKHVVYSSLMSLYGLVHRKRKMERENYYEATEKKRDNVAKLPSQSIHVKNFLSLSLTQKLVLNSSPLKMIEKYILHSFSFYYIFSNK